MIQEQWRPIPGYEGRYDVSDMGRVRNAVTLQVLRGLPSNGYLQVHLYHPDGSHRCRINRLVLLAFAGPCPAGMESAHEDGDRTNNVLTNLRWKTPGENAMDRMRHGTQVAGERVSRAVLTVDKVREIRGLVSAGMSSRAIAKHLGLGLSTVKHVRSGRCWKHVKGIA